MSWTLWSQIMILIFWAAIMTDLVMSSRSKARRQDMAEAARLAREAVGNGHR